METQFVPMLDDKTIQKELDRMKERYPDYEIDRSLTLDKTSPSDDTDTEYVFDFSPDEIHTRSPELLPEVEAMRLACISGDLIAVQNTFKIYWLDVPADERIHKDVFGASGFCEAIKRDDSAIASYLLSNVLSMHEGHFALATESRSYSFLQFCIDRGWDINVRLGMGDPPALS